MSDESLVPSLMASSGMKGVIDAVNKLEQTIKDTASYLFADNETPAGTINGSNKVFTVADNPNPDLSLKVYLNGDYKSPSGVDYTLSGTTITFVVAPAVDDVLRVFYRYK